MQDMPSIADTVASDTDQSYPYWSLLNDATVYPLTKEATAVKPLSSL